MNWEGVLPVFKPEHYTSHDVVSAVRKMLRIKKVGHTGTLDPMVTGVLPVCVGRATRIVEYMQDVPKEYEAVLKIGIATDTEDMSGQIIAQSDEVHVTQEAIEQVIPSFLGTIEQIPPMYSAVKVDGKKLYEIARQGKEIERNPRKVTIYQIQILHMELQQPYPEVKIRVRCSKGTYIRTLCADIGKALGYPATMSHLVRIASGNIRLDQCLTLEEIKNLHRDHRLQEHMIPLDQAIDHLPMMTLQQRKYVQRALVGQRIPLHAVQDYHQLQHQHAVIRLYAPDHTFLGIYRMDEQKEAIIPVKVFS